MECILCGLTYETCLIYLDDVIIFSCTFEEHLLRLEEVLQRFRKVNIKLKPSKCHFCCDQVNYLGHVVSSAGVAPDPQKVSVVNDFPVPRNVKQVHSFLGLCNYYRKFVRGFAKIAAPLNQLTRKSTPFVWDEHCQTTFDTLKQALTEAPILAYPDITLPFDLYVDASDEGIGMVLGQRQEGIERVIAYAGRSLNPAERNYSVAEREGLAVVDGIKHFQSYLYGRHFTIYTDHNALKWLMILKEPTGRLACWSVLLQQYDFEIKHRSGTTNGNADALSRRPYLPLITALDKPGEQTDRIHELQRCNPSLADIIDYLQHDILPSNNQSAKILPHTIDDYYLDQDGLLCHMWTPGKGWLTTPRSQLVVPTALRLRDPVISSQQPPGRRPPWRS